MWALLLCGLSLAAPPVTESATYDRLFQEAPTAESVATPDPGPSVPGWAVPAGILGLAGALLLYKKVQTPKATASSPALRVVQRQGLGDRNALVLVEVVEPSGDIRRLLIGTGSGAPVLLSDLGLAEDVPANTAMPVDAKGETKVESRVAEVPVVSKPPPEPKARPAFNIADEILAERTPAPGRAREFAKILARIGDE
jgi:hypothetical protein